MVLQSPVPLPDISKRGQNVFLGIDNRVRSVRPFDRHFLKLSWTLKASALSDLLPGLLPCQFNRIEFQQPSSNKMNLNVELSDILMTFDLCHKVAISAQVDQESS